ncbi:MAG TPA: trehalase family glycosidase [Blastocatellia bacterium]|nr:trehalase family glycosidase [Blastocatellia bacterium]
MSIVTTNNRPDLRQFIRLLRRRCLSLFVVLSLTVAVLPAGGAARDKAADKAARQKLESLQSYIKKTWHALTRSNARLAEAASDPKFPIEGRQPVYLARDENLKKVQASLRGEMGKPAFSRIELRQLPPDPSDIHEQGLLYLPYPYVVPGGRFNEMYGWDSYFIQAGLIRNHEFGLAKNITDNFLYEVVHYGKILNANRTYYLTRSQPPFLTEMVSSVFRETHDREWLARAVPAIEKYYEYWTRPPHLTPETGLSRYYDLGAGPAPEVAAERDEKGQTHYDRVKLYYKTNSVTDYDLSQYYDQDKDQLTPLFFEGDRSMRESGFDPSNRFGPFNIDIIHYDPVCLNCLLYMMETQTSEIMKTLGKQAEADQWLSRASTRKDLINRFCWDERDGLYYDYNWVTGAVRRYPFATTFYPLWTGIADRDRASRLVANLNLFERAGGLQTSKVVTGSQWDAPFGWAPLQMLAVEGLRRYGYDKEADRISVRFLSLILKEFNAHSAIFEKYDVVNRCSEVSAGIKFGYGSNEIGFGWTNAAFLELYGELPLKARIQVLDTS